MAATPPKRNEFVVEEPTTNPSEMGEEDAKRKNELEEQRIIRAMSRKSSSPFSLDARKRAMSTPVRPVAQPKATTPTSNTVLSRPVVPAVVKAPSVVRAPSVTKAPSVVRAPSVPKAFSVVRAPSATKAPSVVRVPSIAKAPTMQPKPADSKPSGPPPEVVNKAVEYTKDDEFLHHYDKSQAREVTFDWRHADDPFVEIGVGGSWNDWKPIWLELEGGSEIFKITTRIPHGTHTYRFYEKGKWRHDPDKPTKFNVATGQLENLIIVE